MWTLVGSGVGVVALVAGVLVFWPSEDASAPDAPPTTRALPTEPAPVPADPTRERWRWDGDVEAVVAAGVGVVATTEDGLVVGIDGSTGRRLWRWRYGENLAGDPVVPAVRAASGGATVLAWSGFAGIGTQLSAVDAFTGRTLWRDEPTAAFAGLAATSSTVIVGETTTGLHPASALRALALDTGQEAWRYAPPAGCELDQSPPGHLAASADVVFVNLACLAAEDWHTDVLALDAASGAMLWQRQVSTAPVSHMAQPIGGGAVAVTSDHPAPNTYELITTAVDERTGQDLGPAGPEIEVEAVVAGGIEVVTEAGVHRVGDPAPRWQFPTKTPTYRTAVQFGGLVARFEVTCGQEENGYHVAFYELSTGAARRSLGCFDRPDDSDPGQIVPAPGAIVVCKDGLLVGYA